jgi:hypothetical protein
MYVSPLPLFSAKHARIGVGGGRQGVLRRKKPVRLGWFWPACNAWDGCFKLQTVSKTSPSQQGGH